MWVVKNVNFIPWQETKNWIVHTKKKKLNVFNYSIARIRCLRARDRSVVCNKSSVVMLLLVACPKLEKSPVETGFNTCVYIDLLAEHDRCLPDHQHPGC